MLGISDITVRPSYRLRRAIEHGEIDPSIEQWLDFFCYKQAKQLMRYDQKTQINLYNQCPDHLRPYISKWVRVIKRNKRVYKKTKRL